MPLERLRKAGVRWCLCSDVGAGPELCMLHVIDTFLDVHRGHTRVTPAQAFWAATWAGADALGFGEERGCLSEGRQADFLVLDDGVGVRDDAGQVVLALVEHARASAWRAPFDSVFVGGVSHTDES
jgi:cytosine/adenosine deaminase-related metal-dependent hydrolase